MRIGKLRHRVELKSVAQTPNTFGEMTDTWSTFATVWASVEPLKGRELLIAQQANSEVTLRVRLRYNSSIDVNDRVVIGSRILEIVSIINPEERDWEQVLLCKEVG